MKILPILAVLILGGNAVIYKLNDTEFNRMPPLMHFDAYESCLADPGGVYCTADYTIVSDTPNDLMTLIQEYSDNNLTHFNYSNIQYGICITRKCKGMYTLNTTMDLKLILEGCLNNSMWDKYKLKVKITDKYFCQSAEQNTDISKLDVAVAALCIFFVVMSIIGSLYGICCLKKYNKRGNKYLLSFSVRHNWAHLTKVTKNKNMECLKALDGTRVMPLIIVIWTHALLPCLVLIDNPTFVERTYDNLLAHTIISGSLVVQTFFLISGCLLTYNIQLTSETQRFRWWSAPWQVLMRWLRLTPAYAVALGITATWMRHLGSGPAWEMIVTPEVNDCQKYGWMHLLYINNYNDVSNCMPHTWYVAADMQLQVVGIVACVLLRGIIRRVVLSLLFLAGIIMPATHTYLQNLDPVLLTSPESTRNFLLTNPTFNHVYKRGHTNLAVFIVGIALGFLIRHLQVTEFDIQKYKKYRYLFWMSYPTLHGMIFLCSFFYGDGPRLPLLLRALIAGFIKPVFSTTVFIMILGTAFRIEGDTPIYRTCLEWQGWTFLRKISYSAYILHLTVVRTTTGSRKQLLHGDNLRALQVALCNTLLVFFISVVFWLVVEAPIDGVLHHLTSPNKKEDINEDYKSDDEKANGNVSDQKDNAIEMEIANQIFISNKECENVD